MPARPPTSLLALILVSCSSEPPADTIVAPNDPASRAPSSDWLSTVTTRVAAAGRAIRAVEGVFVVDLAPAGLDGRFDEAGVVFTDVHTGEPALGLRLTGWGRAGALRAPEPADPDLGACGPEVDPTGACIRQLEHARGDGLTEWWLGQPNGVEQGWTLDRAPAGAGDLRFEVALDEALGVDGDGAALALTDARGRAWTIDGVVAWDARGEPLPAEARFEGDALVVTVDDTDATYPVTVDPIYTTAAWTWMGSSLNYFAYTVAGVGNVDGDGYDDIAVAAWAVGDATGAVYLFHGSVTGTETVATTRLEGEATSSDFGYAVAGAGDVDGDGYDDVVVGAPGWSSDTGRAYVFHGGASGVSTTATTTLEGSATNEYFGSSVAGAGDVDADGYPDIIVGARGNASGVGAASVYHGSATGIPSTATTTLTGPGAAASFGEVVAGAGDVNADGYDDVIVGSYYYSSQAGHFDVFHGSASGVSTAATTSVTGSTASMQLGDAVAGAGDVNGDGYDDVIVGAPGYSTNTGRAYVHHGSATGISASATTTLVGFTTSNYFGESVDGPGDVDGDGYDDVAVGAWGYSTSKGRVTVYAGSSAGINSLAVTTLTGGATSDQFGWSVAGAGDVDNDGDPDLVVGAIGAGDGTAYVYLGDAAGLGTTASRTIESVAPYVYVPLVAAAGDVNGDGYDDIAIGSYRYDSYAGIVYVLHGGSDGPDDMTADTTITGGAAAYLGQTIAPAGDVNGDGYGDLLVGGDDYSTYTGRVELYLGSATGLDTTAATTLTGTSANDSFGVSLSALGDTNGDGYDDVLIGASGSGSGGAAYLYRGKYTGLNSSATTSFTGATASMGQGREVVAGDFDGDGYIDAAAGAPSYTSSQGQVTVYQGTASGIGTAAWSTFYGEAASNWFGAGMGAADINGDGYDDLAINAYGYDGYTGRLYVYYGSSAGLPASPTTVIDGIVRFDVAGDTNADGYADLAVSSSYGAYLLQGSASGLDATPVSVPDSADGYSGASVAGAGDVNGDGYDDVLTGGTYHAWLFYGYDTDADADGSPDSADCDDTDATIYVGAIEVCDGVDQDCDGTDDDGVSTTLYADADSDGYGDDATAVTSCATTIAGYVAVGGDCDDTRATTSPVATESCDGVDDDCDGEVDEDGATGSSAWYADADADGYGSASVRDACSAPSGYVADSTDCDDTLATVSPAATEACNGVDDDCDGATDEPGATGESTWYSDADGDGSGNAGASVSACDAPSGYVATATDCDDAAATVFAGATETCNTVDDDCDGTVDEGLTTAWYYDADGDGYTGTFGVDACAAPTGYTADAADCDDTSASTFPGAAETCDGADQDCDGTTDEGVLLTFYADADGDGSGVSSTTADACAAPAGYAAVAGDCDDTSATISPTASETCDGVDQDCDGAVDDGALTTWHRDADRDGYGDLSVTTDACEEPTGYVADATDCDDGSAGVYPGALERCDELDNDCDSVADEDVTPYWYRDTDGDGYGWAADSVASCTQPEGYAANADDCNDADATVTEGVTGYRDADGDGFGDVTQSMFGCAIASGYVADATDCDDTLDSVYPGAPESWYDGVDQDCDGNDDDQDGDGAPSADDCDDTDPAVVTCDTATDTDTDTDDTDAGAEGDTGGKTEPSACGCASTGTPVTSAALLGLLALTVTRRRRATAG